MMDNFARIMIIAGLLCGVVLLAIDNTRIIGVIVIVGTFCAATCIIAYEELNLPK